MDVNSSRGNIEDSMLPAKPSILVRFYELVRFFWASASGLVIDLVFYTVFISVGIVPWVANLTSSTMSITAVYFLAARYAFKAKTKLSTYIVFFGWYSLSILLFSFVVAVLSESGYFSPIAAKLITVPISFSINFIFSRFIFSRFV